MQPLSPDRWQLVQAHLDQALSLPTADLPAWLGFIRQSDAELASELEALLDEYQAVQRERFLEDRASLLVPGERPGDRYGAYTLVSPIGEGGMGAVWLAERGDGRFTRRAAVKLPQLAFVQGGAERFTREGRILARLAHPHIAQLLDAGISASGRPYLVLEHVAGVAIDTYCDSRRMSVERRLRLFLDVLQAVSHAHANLVVHRDIKPSNVLVTDDGQVKLLDFGVAKLLEDEGRAGAATQVTRAGGSWLTLEYAAPEQVAGGPVSVATDVYGLGVLLFVLLTGQHPAGPRPHPPGELIRSIVETDTPAASHALARRGGDPTLAADATTRGTTPAALRRSLAGDLDTIVAKALQKRPEDRYVSVSAFSDDLRRHLADEPISARRDRLAYRAAKFVRRNRTAVALAVIGAVAALAGLAGTVLQAERARAERDFALYELTRAEAINDLDGFLLSDAAPSGRPLLVNDLLSRAEQIVRRQRAGEAGRVDLLVAIGRQYLMQDADAAASRVLREAYRSSRDVAEPSTRARAACALAATLVATGEGERAERLYQEGLHDLPDDARFARDHVYCLEYGAYVARERGAAREAVARSEMASRLVQQAPFRSNALELGAMMGLAESYRVAGRQRDAAKAFAEASARLTAAGRDQTSAAGTLFNNWALTLYQLGRPLESEPLYRRAIDISRQDATDGAVSPMLMVNYARTLFDLHRVDDAAGWAERGQAKAEKAGDEVVVNQALLLRAGIYREKADLAGASAMLAAVAPRLRRALPAGHVAFAAVRSQESLIALAAGRLSSAMRLANDAMAIARAAAASGGQGSDILPTLLTRRSDIEARLGRASDAERDARDALHLLQTGTHAGTGSATTGRAHLALGRALLQLKREPEGRSELQLAARDLEAALGAEHPETRDAAGLLSSSSSLFRSPK
jgi:eukaryotic-like serine/threonine-protein kinase